MNPMIVYVENTNDKTITLSKEDFEEYLRKAYTQGKSDGVVVNNFIINPINPWTSPSIPSYPWVTYTTSTNINIEPDRTIK